MNTELLLGFLALALPIAVSITKVTDFIRNSFDKEGTLPKWTWNIVPFALGVGYCLLFEVNLHETMVGLHPAASSAMAGVGGQIATGLAVGAMASFWHEKLDEWSSIAKGAEHRRTMPEEPGPN